MSRYLISVLSLMLLSLSAVCPAVEPTGSGIVFPVTKVIYPESETDGINFTVINNTDTLYLLQSRVISDRTKDANGGEVPFIVIPPLIRFEPGASVILLIRQSGKVTPTDQESLFRLALKTIPAQPGSNRGEAVDASLMLALQNNLKLLYRPSALPPLTVKERAARLMFTAKGGMLMVKNPTPYYVTFSKLQDDGQPVNTGNDNTIAPYNTVCYPASAKLSRDISWSVVDDQGTATERREQSLH